MTPCGEWHARELELLVQYSGFSPMEAIVAATRNGALAMRMEDEIGTVQPGRAADLLVVDGDPSRDVRILQDKTRIREVIARGRRIDLVTPIPERKVNPGEQVRFLAACPLTQSLAFTDAQLQALSQV